MFGAKKNLKNEQDALEQQINLLPSINLPTNNFEPTENLNLKYSLAVGQTDRAGTANLSTPIEKSVDNSLTPQPQVNTITDFYEQTSTQGVNSEQEQTPQASITTNLLQQTEFNPVSYQHLLDPFDKSPILSSKKATEAIIQQNLGDTNTSSVKIAEGQQFTKLNNQFLYFINKLIFISF